MLVTQSSVFDVPIALSTIVQIRETNSYQRTLVFRNLTASTLSFQIEQSADGGSTWTIIGTSFVVGAIGSGTEVIIKNVDTTNILRVRGSGGGDDRDLYFGFVRAYLDENNIWSSPLV